MVFQLYDALRFDSTVVINVVNSIVVKYTVVLINISSPKLNSQLFISKLRAHEYISGLTSTPKAELFCSCKCRKFIGQNKVKILSF